MVRQADSMSAGRLKPLLQSVLANPAEVTRLAAGELDLVLRGMRRVRLLGWLGTRLEETGDLQSLPEAAREQLASALVVAAARARLARWELDRVAWALESGASPQVIALKGCAYLLRGLPNAAGRLFADVDLMVAEEDLNRVERALARRGWLAAQLSPYDDNFYRAWSHELPAMVHAEREVEVDVHHNIRGRFAPFRPDATLMIRASVPIAGSGFRSLSDPDLVLHAMTHLMFGGDLADGLRDLVDIDMLIRHFADIDDAFWQRFVARAERLDLGLPAFYSLRYAARLIGTPVPETVLESIAAHAPVAIVVRLMDRLVPAGLLPQDPDRMSARVAIARWLLYVRSHWVSMPPLMLVRHLAYKFYVRHLRGRIRGRRPTAA